MQQTLASKYIDPITAWLLGVFCWRYKIYNNAKESLPAFIKSTVLRTSSWEIPDFELRNFWEKEDLEENWNLSWWYGFGEKGEIYKKIAGDKMAPSGWMNARKQIKQKTKKIEKK